MALTTPLSGRLDGNLQRHHYSPSAHQLSQGVQVALVGCPEGGREAVLVGGVAVPPGGFAEDFEVAIAGGPAERGRRRTVSDSVNALIMIKRDKNRGLSDVFNKFLVVSITKMDEQFWCPTSEDEL